MKVSEAVVLMAGVGSRLAVRGAGTLKPLTPVLDRPLISYVFDVLNAAGIETVHAIVGYERDALVGQLTRIIPTGLNVRFIDNPNWRKQNGISVLAARGHVRLPFLLTMSDHLFDDELLGTLLREADPKLLNLAIDRKIETIVDIDDAMKVQTSRGRVISIGKELKHYDAIDTGLFVANEELFDYLDSAKHREDCSLADGVRRMAADGKVKAVDVGDTWWQDVDTPVTLQAASNHLRRSAHTSTRVAAGARAQQ